MAFLNGSAGHSGLIGSAGMLLEFKHGVPAIIEPFLKCHSFSDVILNIHYMDDVYFLGVFFWLVLLGFSVYSLCIVGNSIFSMLGKRAGSSSDTAQDD